MKNLELISKIALITAENKNFDIQMNSIIELLGRYTQVSRVYIFIDNNESNTTSNTFEWCNSGVEPQINGLQEFPYERIPSWRKILLEEGRVYTNDIGKLPKDIAEALQPQGILSLVAYPLYIENKLKGFIGFDDCEEYRMWNDTELKLLEIISRIVSNVYEKHFALEKSNQMKDNLEHFFHLVEDFFIIGNMEGDILFSNDSVVENLGYSLDELQKMKIIDLHPPGKRDEARKILGEMMEGKEDYCPLELMSKDGSIFPVETRIWVGKWNDEDCIFGVSKNLSKEQEALQKFTKMFKSNPTLMAVSTIPERIIIDVNSMFIEKIGYSYDEVVGKTCSELRLFVQPEKQLEVEEEFKKTGKMHNVELQVECKNGEILDGLFSGEIIESQGKEYFLVAMADITRQKRLQNLYSDEKIRLHSIIEGARLGTWEWNVQTGETIFNERWAEIIGYTLEELQPVSIETWEKYCHTDDLKKIEVLLEKHFSGEADFHDVECRMHHRDGRLVWVHDRGKVIKWDEDGKPLMMYGTHCDITEKKEIERRIKEISIRDPLTNAYNRRYIYERLSKELERYRRQNIIYSVAILDIDFFKRINDTFGHLAGDYILKEFTAIISENLREYDLLGRYGGEEFIIVMYDSDKKKSANIVQRILDITRSKTFKYNDGEIKFTFSGGIADVSEFAQENMTNQEMISLADKRLYTAKQGGRDRIVLI